VRRSWLVGTNFLSSPRCELGAAQLPACTSAADLGDQPRLAPARPKVVEQKSTSLLPARTLSTCALTQALCLAPPRGGAADRLGETPWGNPHQDPNRGVAPLVGPFPTRPAPSQALTRLRQRILHLRWQTYPLRAPPSQLADFPWGGVLCATHRYQASHEAVNREDTCPPQGAKVEFGYVKNVRLR